MRLFNWVWILALGAVACTQGDYSPLKESNRPSKEGEGVPGYIIHPELITFLEQGATTLFEILGQANAVESDDGDPTFLFAKALQISSTEEARAFAWILFPRLDLNSDGEVSQEEVNTFVADLGVAMTENNLEYDFNKDGVVNLGDLGIINAAFTATEEEMRNRVIEGTYLGHAFVEAAGSFSIQFTQEVTGNILLVVGPKPTDSADLTSGNVTLNQHQVVLVRVENASIIKLE